MSMKHLPLQTRWSGGGDALSRALPGREDDMSEQRAVKKAVKAAPEKVAEKVAIEAPVEAKKVSRALLLAVLVAAGAQVTMTWAGAAAFGAVKAVKAAPSATQVAEEEGALRVANTALRFVRVQRHPF